MAKHFYGGDEIEALDKALSCWLVQGILEEKYRYCQEEEQECNQVDCFDVSHHRQQQHLSTLLLLLLLHLFCLQVQQQQHHFVVNASCRHHQREGC